MVRELWGPAEDAHSRGPHCRLFQLRASLSIASRLVFQTAPKPWWECVGLKQF